MRLWEKITRRLRRAPEGPARPAASRPPKAQAGSELRPGESATALLIRVAEMRYEFGRSLAGEPIAVPKGGPRIAYRMSGTGLALRSELADEYHRRTSRVPNASTLTDVLTVLEGRARRGAGWKVSVRVEEAGGSVWLDMGDQEGTVIQVDARGWRLASEAPVLFRRSELTGAMPRPQQGDLSLLRQFLNVDDDGWDLLKGWLVAALHPSSPQPILILTGEQGTAKSTTARLLVNLIDPSPAPLRSMPRDPVDWAVTADASWVVAIDNVSKVPQWLSDAMCRAVTGDGFARRRLYTNSEITVQSFRRSLILTGIDLGNLSADLIDRSVFVELERITATDRRPEADLRSDFEKARPQILGGLLDLLTAAVRHLPHTRLLSYPRMADYARLLAALDSAEDTNCLGAYTDATQQATAHAVDADAVALAVMAFVDEAGPWTGTATELLAALSKNQLHFKGFPTQPQHLSYRLTKAAPALRASGIAVERSKGTDSKRTRLIHLSRLVEDNSEGIADRSSGPSGSVRDAQVDSDAPDAQTQQLFGSDQGAGK